ncbi:hypothetical protein PG994_000973 [Apiospora phragmitis]|uniref:Rhodopsin domain-containing protein n=1 Tax=Apiospora phragmitis TaxID=2905665 RepID=A0ABR1WSD1_9PEZI
MNSYGRAILITSILFSILALLLTGAWIWARRITRSRLRLNDYIIIANSIITFALCVATEWAAMNASIEVPKNGSAASAQVVSSRKFMWSFEIVATFVIGTVKLGVLLFYQQVFATQPRFNVAATVLLGLCGAWTVVFVLLIVFKRAPISNEWNLPADSPDILLDLAILTLPFPVLSSLQLSRKRKIQVGAIFCLGALLIDGDPSYNYSDSVTNVIVWSILEACFSIIVADLPHSYENVSDEKGSPDLQLENLHTVPPIHMYDHGLARFESV